MHTRINRHELQKFIILLNSEMSDAKFPIINYSLRVPFRSFHT